MTVGKEGNKIIVDTERKSDIVHINGRKLKE